MSHYKNVLLTSVLLCPLSIFAQNGTSTEIITSDETQELEQLLELLQEQTSIATKTRLNADYVPGMVTVLPGHDLENRGVRTVWEALARVPGIELSIEETGRKQAVIRGIGRTYASSNIKILLNGTSMNTANIAHANPVMNIPVEQVERIEVIRGPGSAIHGEFALTGVVNVITRKEESRVFLMAGEDNTRGAGVMLTYDEPNSPLSMNINLAGWETDGPNILTGEDELYIENNGANSAYSNAPGPTNEAAEDKTAILSLNYNDFSLTAQILKDGYGDHFGRNQFLPPDEKRIVTRNEYQTLDINQAIDLGNGWSSELFAGWQDKEQTKDHLYAGPSAGDPTVTQYVDIFYREWRRNMGVDFRWTDSKIHNTLIGVEYVDIQVDHELIEVIGSDGSGFSYYWIDPDKRRRIISTTLQEEYRPRDDLTLTFGLRHDKYNDLDSELSPRLAAVWRHDQNNVFKAQFARAFRPLTFYELAADAHVIADPIIYAPLEGSTITTSELGYIHKNINSEYRITLFYSEIDKFVVFIDQTGFTNTDSATLYGLEFELMHKLSKSLSIDTNISLLNTDDKNTGKSIPGSADWIGNFGLNYKPGSRSNLALQYHAVGETYREATDTRNELKGYNTTDATLSITDLFGANIGFRAGIKNLFDKDIKYPAPVLTYVDDHPRAGRQWWLQISYDF